jgi:hypothetical protein
MMFLLRAPALLLSIDPVSISDRMQSRRIRRAITQRALPDCNERSGTSRRNRVNRNPPDFEGRRTCQHGQKQIDAPGSVDKAPRRMEEAWCPAQQVSAGAHPRVRRENARHSDHAS